MFPPYLPAGLLEKTQKFGWPSALLRVTPLGQSFYTARRVVYPLQGNLVDVVEWCGHAEDRMKLHELLRERRVGAGLSQNEVAGKVGVTQATVSNWELGKSEPSDSQVKDLEAILGSLRQNSGGRREETSATEASPFGVWLTTVRTRRNLTAVELAGRAGVSSMTIYNLESGRILNPQERTRKAIVKALGEEPPAETLQATEAASSIEGLGTFEDFDPHDDSRLPEGPGVYVFYDVSDRPVYVGESSDVRTRIRSHSDKFWFKRPIVQNASYLPIGDPNLRKQVERVLIRFLKSNAVLNKQHVGREEGRPGRRDSDPR